MNDRNYPRPTLAWATEFSDVAVYPLSIDWRSSMIATETGKSVHAPGFSPFLFCLANDPGELTDLGRSPEHADIRRSIFNRLSDWSLRFRQRETWPEERDIQMTGLDQRVDALIGYWDENDAAGKGPNILPIQKPRTAN